MSFINSFAYKNKILFCSKIEKTANLSQNCPKMAICKICNLAVVVWSENDCKLDKDLKQLLENAIFLKNPKGFMILEFEVCALMRLFLTRLYSRFFVILYFQFCSHCLKLVRFKLCWFYGGFPNNIIQKIQNFIEFPKNTEIWNWQETKKLRLEKISNNHGKSLHLLTGNLKQRPHPNDPTSAPLIQPPPPMIQPLHWFHLQPTDSNSAHLFNPQLLNPPPPLIKPPSWLQHPLIKTPVPIHTKCWNIKRFCKYGCYWSRNYQCLYNWLQNSLFVIGCLKNKFSYM